MARPIKLGLDYFPTDTDILKNIKIRKLIRKYRELGFVLYLQLLTDIYRNSYFIELSDEYIFDLADQFHKRDKTILEMIDFMVEVDLFNKNLRNILILTSPSIQKRYFAVKGNSYKGLEKDLLYILIPLSTEKPPVISEEIPQSKVKERKGKESKENESINLIVFEYPFLTFQLFHQYELHPCHFLHCLEKYFSLAYRFGKQEIPMPSA